jgi:hypothetical protein
MAVEVMAVCATVLAVVTIVCLAAMVVADRAAYANVVRLIVETNMRGKFYAPEKKKEAASEMAVLDVRRMG